MHDNTIADQPAAPHFDAAADAGAAPPANAASDAAPQATAPNAKRRAKAVAGVSGQAHLGSQDLPPQGRVLKSGSSPTGPRLSTLALVTELKREYHGTRLQPEHDSIFAKCIQALVYLRSDPVAAMQRIEYLAECNDVDTTTRLWLGKNKQNLDEEMVGMLHKTAAKSLKQQAHLLPMSPGELSAHYALCTTTQKLTNARHVKALKPNGIVWVNGIEARFVKRLADEGPSFIQVRAAELIHRTLRGVSPLPEEEPDLFKVDASVANVRAEVARPARSPQAKDA